VPKKRADNRTWVSVLNINLHLKVTKRSLYIWQPTRICVCMCVREDNGSKNNSNKKIKSNDTHAHSHSHTLSIQFYLHVNEIRAVIFLLVVLERCTNVASSLDHSQLSLKCQRVVGVSHRFPPVP